MGEASKEDSIAEVREYAFKFLQMLLFLSQEFRAKFIAQGGYDTLTDFTIQTGMRQEDPFFGAQSLLTLAELDSIEAHVCDQIP